MSAPDNLPPIFPVFSVDDLEEIGNLEQYVAASQCVLIFLSKGYFHSANCRIELNSALRDGIPLILVQEADLKKGKLSVTSPISRSLVGKSEGDVVTIKTPSGNIEYEIIEVKYV